MHRKQLECFNSVSHKYYNENNELLNFGKNFQRWLFLKFEFLNYQSLIKGYKKKHTKERENLSVFEKSYKEKRKKVNISISRTCLNKACLNTKINLRLKKHKKNFGGNFKNTLKIFCRRHQKNASRTITIYGNCMTSVFFQSTEMKKCQSFQL